MIAIVILDLSGSCKEGGRLGLSGASGTIEETEILSVKNKENGR